MNNVATGFSLSPLSFLHVVVEVCFPFLLSLFFASVCLWYEGDAWQPSRDFILSGPINFMDQYFLLRPSVLASSCCYCFRMLELLCVENGQKSGEWNEQRE